jgi:hypothetical protein
MKFISYLSFASAITILICYSALAQQSRWAYVGEDASGALFYLDKTSQQSVGNIIKVWDKIVYKDGSYRISQTNWKCSEKKFFIVDVTIYSPTSSFIGKDKTNTWLSVVPDSISEVMHREVCGAYSGKSIAKVSSSKKIAEVIVEKANVRTKPNTNSRVIKQASFGERFNLADEESSDGWYQITIARTNEKAWIHGNNIKLVKATNKSNTKKQKVKQQNNRKKSN